MKPSRTPASDQISPLRQTQRISEWRTCAFHYGKPPAWLTAKWAAGAQLTWFFFLTIQPGRQGMLLQWWNTLAFCQQEPEYHMVQVQLNRHSCTYEGVTREDRRALDRWKATMLWRLLLDLQTQRSNLLVDQSGLWFLLFVFLFMSVTHRRKPKQQMGEEPHKDLTVSLTKTASCQWFRCYRVASGHCGKKGVWRRHYRTLNDKRG